MLDETRICLNKCKQRFINHENPCGLRNEEKVTEQRRSSSQYQEDTHWPQERYIEQCELIHGRRCQMSEHSTRCNERKAQARGTTVANRRRMSLASQLAIVLFTAV